MFGYLGFGILGYTGVGLRVSESGLKVGLGFRVDLVLP